MRRWTLGCLCRKSGCVSRFGCLGGGNAPRSWGWIVTGGRRVRWIWIWDRCPRFVWFENINLNAFEPGFSLRQWLFCLSCYPGFPIKLFNYLGMGLPTNIAKGSYRPITGVICVPNHSPVEMADAIQRIVERSDGTRQLGQDARTFVLRECSWDSRAEELEALYSTFLDATVRGRSRPQMRQWWSQGNLKSARTRHGSA